MATIVAEKVIAPPTEALNFSFVVALCPTAWDVANTATTFRPILGREALRAAVPPAVLAGRTVWYALVALRADFEAVLTKIVRATVLIAEVMSALRTQT